MKNFNRSIKVEISVDSIAAQLLENINPEFKHRELVTEALIGRMLSSDNSGLSFLYNSLNGYGTSIDFKVGDVIVPTELTAYGYWTAENVERGNRSSAYIKTAVVTAIDEYADDKLTIEYLVPDRKGTVDRSTSRINHTLCSKVPVTGGVSVDTEEMFRQVEQEILINNGIAATIAAKAEL